MSVNETNETHVSCDGCRHYLGGGCCAVSLESECAAGEFEAWVPSPPLRGTSLGGGGKGTTGAREQGAGQKPGQITDC